jgi:hypothetical protein
MKTASQTSTLQKSATEFGYQSEMEWNFGFMDVDWLRRYCKTQVDSRHVITFRSSYLHNNPTALTIIISLRFEVDGLFSMARARNAAPVAVSSAIAASIPSLVVSHLGLNIPVVQRAHWARSIVSAAVANIVDETVVQMPQVWSVLASDIHIIHSRFAYFTLFCRYRKCLLAGNSR